MYVVVSDTNVFVALFKCGLLFKVFASSRVEVVIPTEVHEELTRHPHRVVREYPDLATLVTTLLRNPNHGHPIKLTLFDFKSLDSIAGMEAHYTLEEDATLDAGERQAIPCAIHLSATFVSCEKAAIDEYEALEEKNGSAAALFSVYCESLLQSGIITRGELDQILHAISE
jgi:hypothetical protein